ncbi:hypothetical protein I4F81_009420 [Pyropia yezoensis]|uniref:Uncharacterized protein n=1 Tax=Pyropia yezoensis TaxID=2788 RepID=A0ACC3CAL2_PYRYE|nr:hypothetical protein I4F81_009420 [Neopyropia yezoensis]
MPRGVGGDDPAGPPGPAGRVGGGVGERARSRRRRCPPPAQHHRLLVLYSPPPSAPSRRNSNAADAADGGSRLDPPPASQRCSRARGGRVRPLGGPRPHLQAWVWWWWGPRQSHPPPPPPPAPPPPPPPPPPLLLPPIPRHPRLSLPNARRRRRRPDAAAAARARTARARAAQRGGQAWRAGCPRRGRWGGVVRPADAPTPPPPSVLVRGRTGLGKAVRGAANRLPTSPATPPPLTARGPKSWAAAPRGPPVCHRARR